MKQWQKMQSAFSVRKMMLKMYQTPDVPHSVCGQQRCVEECVGRHSHSGPRLQEGQAQSTRDLLGVSSIPGRCCHFDI